MPKSPVPRLADFGIAVHESDVRFTHVGMVNGTPGYMAPELFAMAEPIPRTTSTPREWSRWSR